MRAGEEVCRRREDRIQRENRYQRKMRDRETEGGESGKERFGGENIAEAITEAEILSL